MQIELNRRQTTIVIAVGVAIIFCTLLVLGVGLFAAVEAMLDHLPPGGRGP
jgi:hypothetical protein